MPDRCRLLHSIPCNQTRQGCLFMTTRPPHATLNTMAPASPRHVERSRASVATCTFA